MSSVHRLCQVPGVSQSGYFAWKDRPASRRQRDDMVMLAHVRSAFALSNGTYLRKLAASRGFTKPPGRHPGVRFGGFPEMRSGDPALAFLPVRRAKRHWREEVWVPVNGGKPKPDEFTSFIASDLGL